MKKFCSLLLVLCMTTTAWSYDFKVGKLYYKITGRAINQTVEVTYQKHRSKENYAGLTEVAIPPTVKYKGVTYMVTGIGEFAFFECSSLKSISIPSTVTSIGGWAFTSSGIMDQEANWKNKLLCIDGCLIKVQEDIYGACVVKEDVRLIGNRAFADCYYLTSVTLPPSVKNIGKETFSKCSHLRSVILPEQLKTIGNNAFTGCAQLQSIVLPESLQSVGSNAFEGCTMLQSVVIPAGVTTVNRSLFAGCQSLQSVQLHDRVTIVGEMAFDRCASLQQVVVPTGVTNIGYRTFAGCTALTTITLPNTLSSLGQYVLDGCQNLQRIVYLGTTSEWKKMYKDVSWNRNAPRIEVQCTDGNLVVE